MGNPSACIMVLRPFLTYYQIFFGFLNRKKMWRFSGANRSDVWWWGGQETLHDRILMDEFRSFCFPYVEWLVRYPYPKCIGQSNPRDTPCCQRQILAMQEGCLLDPIDWNLCIPRICLRPLIHLLGRPWVGSEMDRRDHRREDGFSVRPFYQSGRMHYLLAFPNPVFSSAGSTPSNVNCDSIDMASFDVVLFFVDKDCLEVVWYFSEYAVDVPLSNAF